ncbi:MAG: lipid A-modifier LpxR family protein [Gammaproteobacteria bacterium]
MVALLLWLGASRAAPAGVQVDGDGREPYATGSIVYLDNDALSAAQRDEDYTGGLAITLAGRRAREWPVSIDPLLGGLDQALGLAGRDGVFELHSAQLGAIAFTPAEVDVAEVIPGDRPYASLLYWAAGRMYLREAQGAAYHSSVSIGVLGLEVVPELQRALHGVIGASRPRGWAHQISDGGEPTLRYTLSRQDLFASRRGGTWGDYDFKSTVGASLGYTTETSAALSLRWGRIGTPWWSFPPERVNYISEPVPVVRASGQRELFLWAGAKLKTPIYNAFLQGQFRDSDLRYDHGDLRPLVAEAWAGATAQLSRSLHLSWVMRYQTSELRDGPGDRELLWGSLFVTHSL